MIDEEGFEYPDEPAAQPLGGVEAAPQGQRHPPARSINEFNFYRSVADAKSQRTAPPEGATAAEVHHRFYASYFVPVSFAAKDWKVTPRRIRALLAAGRLAGQLKANGYWEVLYPYQFAFGTRGPSLKRQQRPPADPKKSELRAV